MKALNVVTELETLAELKRIKQQKRGDIEAGHLLADKALCDFLVALGYSEIVDAYNEIDKWFA